MLTKVIIGLLLCISLAQAIRIHTSEYQPIYSGDNGELEKGWDKPAESILYTKYISVAEFVFSSSDDAYVYYGPSIEETMSAPKVEVEVGSDIVQPILTGDAKEGYRFDGSSPYEEIPHLNVIFNCQKNGKAILSLTVEVIKVEQDVEDAKPVKEEIKFYFSKECSNSDGHRKGFHVGKNAVNDVVNHGMVQTKWLVDSSDEVEADSAVIPDNEEYSYFTIAISSPAYGNQYYFAPEIFVEDDDVASVTVRGSASGGVANSNPSVTEAFYLVYECHSEGTTRITVSISLGFYGTLRFGFLKACSVVGAPVDGNNAPVSGLSNPGLINVGTSRSEYASIVDQSVTSLYWDVVTSTVVIDRDEIFTNFYISTKSGETQQVLKPIVTIDPPVFGVSLSGSFRDGGVATGAPSLLTVNYLCNRVSEANVIVTLKLPGFRTVEFSYLKKCKALKRHKGHVWTANQVMIIFVAFVVSVGLCGFCYYRKKT